MGHALEDIYHNEDYPFFFVSLITDMSSKAMSRVSGELNISGYPTGWWDGGYDILVGGYEDLPRYRTRLESSGAREVPELDLSVELKWNDSADVEIDLILVNNYFFNIAPDEPVPPIGGVAGAINFDYDFSTVTNDADGHQIYYRFDFDDGTITDLIGPFNSGDTCTATHSWSVSGEYNVMVQAEDEHGKTSEWSNASLVTIYDFVSGDPTSDGLVNILDVLYLITFVYQQGPLPDPYSSGDANANGIVNLMDIVYLLAFLYQGGPPPIY